MYESSSNFSSWVQLKGRLCKTFDILISTKSVFFKFQFGGFGGAAAWQPPPPSGVPLLVGPKPGQHVFTTSDSEMNV
jgi:hypothetical protein